MAKLSVATQPYASDMAHEAFLAAKQVTQSLSAPAEARATACLAMAEAAKARAIAELYSASPTVRLELGPQLLKMIEEDRQR